MAPCAYPYAGGDGLLGHIQEIDAGGEGAGGVPVQWGVIEA